MRGEKFPKDFTKFSEVYTKVGRGAVGRSRKEPPPPVIHRPLAVGMDAAGLEVHTDRWLGGGIMGGEANALRFESAD